MAKLAKSTAYAGGATIGLSIATGIKAVKAASALGEQVNKTGVVFGASSKMIQAFGKTTAAGLGISNEQALKAAGIFGNMLVPMGVSRVKAAGMSKRMVKLAADMASFNDADPSEVLDALRSGLAGESEPLRKFGVFLSDARLKQEALNRGIYSGKGPLTALQKMTATYAVILKDTKDAQGDFGRTVGTSIPNASRVLKASLADVSAAFGTGLLPVVLKATQALRERMANPAFMARVRELGTLVGTKLYTAFQSIKTWFEANWPAIKSGIQGAANFMRGLARAAGRVHGWFQKLGTFTPGGEGTLVGLIVGGLILRKMKLLNAALLLALRRFRLLGGAGAAAGGIAAGTKGKGGAKGPRKMPFIPGPPILVAATSWDKVGDKYRNIASDYVREKRAEARPLHVTLQMDKRTLATMLIPEFQRYAAASAPQTRGRHGGNGTGIR